MHKLEVQTLNGSCLDILALSVDEGEVLRDHVMELGRGLHLSELLASVLVPLFELFDQDVVRWHGAHVQFGIQSNRGVLRWHPEIEDLVCVPLTSVEVGLDFGLNGGDLNLLPVHPTAMLKGCEDLRPGEGVFGGLSGLLEVKGGESFEQVVITDAVGTRYAIFSRIVAVLFFHFLLIFIIQTIMSGSNTLSDLQIREIMCQLQYGPNPEYLQSLAALQEAIEEEVKLRQSLAASYHKLCATVAKRKQLTDGLKRFNPDFEAAGPTLSQPHIRLANDM